MLAARATTPRPAASLVASRARLRRRVAVAAARCESRQLGTARLPADTNLDAFAASLYQWASSLTLTGANLPFALAQRVDRLPTGFSVRPTRRLACSNCRAYACHARQLAFLQRDAAGKLTSVATITAAVEQVDGAPMCVISGEPAAVLDTLVDVPLVMESMPSALRRAVATSRSPPAANF